uniref:Uncharacterized protein n=1 Tax=Rhizophora mucronata TaxID=61149 RepID=A0A2P2IX82_RHIMU
MMEQGQPSSRQGSSTLEKLRLKSTSISHV